MEPRKIGIPIELLPEAARLSPEQGALPSYVETSQPRTPMTREELTAHLGRQSAENDKRIASFENRFDVMQAKSDGKFAELLHRMDANAARMEASSAEVLGEVKGLHATIAGVEKSAKTEFDAIKKSSSDAVKITALVVSIIALIFAVVQFTLSS